MKIHFFQTQKSKNGFKTLKIYKILTKIDSKTNRIALKRWKNRVLSSEIHFETDFNHKKYLQYKKSVL